ncbi:YciI family protein [Corallococcus sp. AB011P]|uniref:YciI family protein n=1 Tax=Corallococcus sp. AB011P TaxID=2316735 RepID=UPI000EA21FE2|nr:YciI family protein [Corallococcus sp. AB011P]RKG49746.1 YciI family protein [Corallococcus sp. AB011P]
MRVMVFMIANEDSEKAVPPTPEAFEAMERYTEELVKAGVMVAGAGLKPTSEARRITCEGPGRTVIDGPFTEARELIAGFSIWKVKDMDEAVAWAKRCPNPMSGRNTIEIRPFFEAEDMAEALSTDAQTREKLGVA